MGNLFAKPEEVPLEQLKHLGWEQGRRREVIRKVNEQSSFPTAWERQANEERDAQKRSNRVKIFTSKAHKYYPGENNTAFDANTGTYCPSENNMDPTFNARKYEPLKDNTCEPGSPTRPELAQKEFCTAVTFFRLTTWNFFCTKIEDTDGKFFADQENGRPEPARDTVKNQKLTGFSILSFRNYNGAFGSQILATFKDTVKDIGKAAGRYILDKAKQVQDWIKKNPRTAAAIIIPLVTLALTPLLLHILGFTAGGIAAGVSNNLGQTRHDLKEL